MYISGGIGALPVIEGFGRPFELDNRYSYSETCAAIGCVLWNREMALATGKARYSDLIEWLLLNAAAVGISLSGEKYFYRNPLLSDGELERQSWFRTACCPSNLSRLWATIDQLVAAEDGPDLRVDQYPSCRIALSDGGALEMKSNFPWEGNVHIEINSSVPRRLRVRLPGWVERGQVFVNEVKIHDFLRQPSRLFNATRFGRAEYLDVDLPRGSSAVVLDFPMDVALLSADQRVRADVGRVAVTRGPLLYCAESIDNPKLNLCQKTPEVTSPRYAFDASLFGSGCGVILAETDKKSDGNQIKLIPYYAWGNRGPSSMCVWLRKGGHQ
jgi:hypothetical protein